MKVKKPAVHFSKYGYIVATACGLSNITSQGGDRVMTRDRRRVTCENCKNSVVWKGIVRR